MKLLEPASVRAIVAIAAAFVTSPLAAADPAPDGGAKSAPAADPGYGLTRAGIEGLGAKGLPFIDFHVHLRGGMTVEKAEARQTALGIKLGVLRNLGVGWPIETDDQLAAFLDGLEGRPVYVGLQVNDRQWHKKHAPELLERVDYFLGDTMIMPMPDEAGPPVKLWQVDGYTIPDPEAWMVRYMRHNLRVLAEPISILANPTYLPPAVADRYDDLWTDARMKTVIQAAIDNRVALEINARSGYPRERFIRLARSMGARFSFGSNNFDDKPIDLSRCFEAITKYKLGRTELFVPAESGVSPARKPVKGRSRPIR